MRVLINALPLRRGGGVTYLRQQLAALARVAPELELHTLVSPWADLAGLPGTTEVVPVKTVARRYSYEQFRLPFRQADLLYCPANFGPLASRAPVVLMIHNAHYYGKGLSLPGPERSLQGTLKIRANHVAMRRARVVVAVSESLAHEAVSSLPSLAHKIHSIPVGRPEWPSEEVPQAGLPERYLLAVTGAAPHKSVNDVVAGWARSLGITKPSVQLVIVGTLTDAQVRNHHAIAGKHAAQITYLGALTDRAKLRWVYAHAAAFVSMSVLESLSLTPLEAGSVDCPLILSDIPAHRETTLGNATFVSPGDRDGLAVALCSVVSGQLRARKPWVWPFSWDDNARLLLELFALCGGRAGSTIGRERATSL